MRQKTQEQGTENTGTGDKESGKRVRRIWKSVRKIRSIHGLRESGTWIKRPRNKGQENLEQESRESGTRVRRINNKSQENQGLGSRNSGTRARRINNKISEN